MNIKFDQEADAVYFYLGEAQVVDSEEVSPDFIYDYDSENNVIGIEILGLRSKTPDQVRSIDFPFTDEQRQELRKFFGLMASFA